MRKNKTSNTINREVKRLIKRLPENKILNLFQIFKVNNGYTNYDSALDDFAFKFGLGMISSPFRSHNGKFKGYLPSIKYYPDNALEETREKEHLVSSLNLLSLSKSKATAAKELIYRLMRVKDPEYYINHNA